jgi:hypothetical protein
MGVSGSSGSGMRSTGVNYATASFLDGLFNQVKSQSLVSQRAKQFAVSYQAVTGVSSGSLKRAAQGVGWNNIRYK